MRELSIEEKAKRYDEAIEKARKWYDANTNEGYRGIFEDILPELKESEDDKVRKKLIHLVKKSHEQGGYALHKWESDEMLAWLEKQEMSYTKKDVDDAYLKGVTDTKNEIVKQYETNYQIRKDIAAFIFNYRGDIKDRAKWIDYLGIKVSFAEKQSEQKPTDKVEPKFKVGDWVFIEEVKGYKQGAFQIKSIDEFGYNFDEYHTIPFMYEELLSKWTIQDAKDGDVLAFNDETIVIFKDLYNATTFHSYCHIEDAIFGVSQNGMPDWWDGKGFKPATKEQYDILMKAMTDAGYTFDFDKKELKEIEKKHTPKHKIGDTIYYNSFGELKSMIVANVTTDSTDNPMYEDENGSAVFEKDLVEQKLTWSEKDEDMLKSITATCELAEQDRDSSPARHLLEMQTNWLESIKNRYTWKPSEEQVRALANACNILNLDYLNLLYQDLKKLKG